MPTIEYWRTTPKMDGIERWITERKLYPQLLSNYRTKTNLSEIENRLLEVRKEIFK